MTPQRPGHVWNLLDIADLLDLWPLAVIAIVVAVLWWLYSRARSTSGPEVAQ